MVALTFAEAKIAAVAAAMRHDERVVVFGGLFGGHRFPTLSAPLIREFPERIFPMPIAELGYVGAAIGAAIGDLKPIVTMGTGSFLFEAWPQIVLEAPSIYYMTAGQVKVPLVVHIMDGIRHAGGAQHSVRPEAMLMQVPGLQIISPTSPYDLMGMLQPVLDSERPTIWVEHVLLGETDQTEEVPETSFSVPIGKAAIKRPGTDVTVVAHGIAVPLSLMAAAEAANEGVSVEVIDLRTLAPLDRESVLGSAARTRRLVIVDESSLTGGVAAEIAASVAEAGVDLAKPLKRVTLPDVPIPLSPPLESAISLTEEKVLAAVRAVTQ